MQCGVGHKGTTNDNNNYSEKDMVVLTLLYQLHDSYKYFPKMFRDVEMVVPKTTESRCRDRAYKHCTNNPFPKWWSSTCYILPAHVTAKVLCGPECA